MKLIFLSILTTLPALVAAPIYTVTDLGSLGGTSAVGYAISGSGGTVGMATDSYGTSHAFRATGDTLLAFESDASAWDVNSSGQMAGARYQNGQAYAVYWADGVGTVIGGAGSAAMGINEVGQVAGMTASGSAFVTGANGQGVTNLGRIGNGGWTSAYDVNNTGGVAGYGWTGTSFRGYVWNPSSGFSLLNTLGGANSYAMALNDSGQVAGHSQTGSGYLHAVLWNGTSAIDLGTLGGTQSFAYDINSSGAVVGYSSTGSGTRAFLYQDAAMMDLNALLANGSGWTLLEAYAINDAGQIVGQGLRNGSVHAFRLDPVRQASDTSPLRVARTPEPSAALLAGTGLALGCMLARRRGK